MDIIKSSKKDRQYRENEHCSANDLAAEPGCHKFVWWHMLIGIRLEMFEFPLPEFLKEYPAKIPRAMEMVSTIVP